MNKKWIDAKQKLNITIFDEQTDEHETECMTIEDILDAYTNEGCPEGYSESNWVLYSERPPKKEGFYLITVDENDRKDVHEAFFYLRRDGTPSWYCEDNVVAWMPLPQPWGGE